MNGARWFPGIRRGTPEQVRTFRDAHKALWRNPDRTETPRYLELNAAAADSCAPLSPIQRAWHFQAALTEFDREQARARRVRRG